MEIFKTKLFDRWATKQGINASALCDAVREMQSGLYEADLGGGLFKKRIARQDQGKSSGFRTLVATNKGSRWIFVFGFAKNERSNIDKGEEAALKALADSLLSLTPQAIQKVQSANELIRVDCNEKKEISDT
jgi:hypothetical protein